MLTLLEVNRVTANGSRYGSCIGDFHRNGEGERGRGGRAGEGTRKRRRGD